MHVRRACRGVVPEPAPEAHEQRCQCPHTDAWACAKATEQKTVACWCDCHEPERHRIEREYYERKQAEAAAQEPAGAQPSGAAEPKPYCRCAGPDKAIESCACTCHAITPETGSPEASPCAQQAPPETRSVAEIEAWNATWKAGYDAAHRDRGWRTFQEVRDENAALRAALASAQQERDHNWQCFTTQLAEYRKVAEERDSAQAQIAALTARAEQAAVLLGMARNGLASVRDSTDEWRSQCDPVCHDIAAWLAASTPAADTPTTPTKETP